MTGDSQAPTAQSRIARVFVSHATEDLRAAEEIYKLLRGCGAQPFMDKFDLVGGEDWERALLREVRKSDFFLFCASPRSVNKRGVIQKEIKEALKVWDEKLEDDIFFIPVRLEPCEVPESIKRFQWIDFFEPDARERIERSLREGLARLHGSETCAVIVTEKTLSNDVGGCFSVDARYPQLQPSFIPELAAINATLESFVVKLVRRFEKRAAQTTAEMGEAVRKVYPTAKDTLNISYRVEYVGAEIVSMAFFQHVYFIGAAHGNTFTHTFNFRRHPFIELDLDDLGKDYFGDIRTQVSKYCADALITEERERLGIPLDEVWIREGTDSVKGNYSRFLVSPEGIRFIFDPYEVSSYAEGRREVLVPISELVENLDNEILSMIRAPSP